MKLYTSLMAAALTVVSASAATFSPGNRWTPSESALADGSSNYLFDLSYSACGSQAIYSINELNTIAPSTAADGSTTYSVIESVELPFYMGMAYMIEGEAEVTVYLTPYDDSVFPTQGSNRVWIDYTAEGTVTGKATVSAYDDDVMNAAYGEDMVIVNVTLDEPLKYTGNSVVMTVITDSSLIDETNEYWFMGTYNFGAGRVASAINKGSGNLTGTIKNSSSTLPIVNFTYSTETVAPEGPKEVFGDHTTYQVGPWETASGSNASVGSMLPASPDKYTHSYAQVIYTPVELAALYTVNADGVTTVDIDELTFKFNDGGDMYEGSFATTVYIQNYDGTTFPVVEGKPQWIAVDKSVVGVAQSEEYYYEMFDTIELEAKFATPLRYDGKSLLVTFVTDSELQGLSEGALEDCVFKASGVQSAVTSSYSALNDLSGNASSTSVWIPVIKLGATPVTTTLATKPVMFDNLTLSVDAVAINSSLTGFNGLTKANNLSLAFDLVNGDESADYTIKMGNTTLGTVHGTHGVINYIELPVGDLTLTVTPVAEGQSGSTVTIAKADVDALLPAPDITAGETAMYASYAAHSDTSTDVEGIASFHFTTTVPVAMMKGTPTVTQTKVVTSSMSWDLPASFQSFLPAGTYNDYTANNGRISYYNSKITSATISHGRLVNPSAVTMDVKFAIDYPMIVLAVPTIDTEVATSLDVKNGHAVKTVTRDYDNGSSFAYTKTQCSVRLDASAEGVLTTDVTYPQALMHVVNSRDNSIDFFAPAGHTIHVMFFPATQAFILAADDMEGDEWVSTGDNIYTHSMDEPGDLKIKTTDADGNDVDSLGLTIDNNGDVTGVEGIAIDSNDTQVRYYDLNGRAVTNPVSGLYIEVKGNQVTKRVIK